MLHNFVSVYVTSTKHYQPISPEEHQQAVREVGASLARICGGFTAYKASGGWLSDTDGLILEDVTIVKAFCSPELKARALIEARNLAEYLRAKFEQDAVTVETEDGIEFIS